MTRSGSLHSSIISALVEALGCESYLEFGTHFCETISKVTCERKYGVDQRVLSIELDNTTFFEMTTAEFIKNEAAKHAPYDFVFIDADHAASAAKEDFFGILPHVSDEGLILLHDTNPETTKDTEPGLCGDSWKAARAITHIFEGVTLPYYPGLTIIRNRKHWGPMNYPQENKRTVDALAEVFKKYSVKCLVNVGACDGFEASALATVTGCRSIAIEGDTRCRPCSDNIEFHYMVIGATDCDTEFYVHNTIGLPGCIKRGNEPMVVVQQERLDTFCNRNNVTPDALLIDTEGTVPDVIAGCGQLLNSVNVVYAECQAHNIDEIDNMLSVAGLTQHEWNSPPSYWADKKKYQGNYTWVRNETD